MCAMPNTDPVTDNQAAVGFIVRQSLRAGAARVYPIGAISVGQEGGRLAEFGELVGAGAVAVSDDGKPVTSGHLMRTALEYARTFGIPVADHCEERTLAAGGVMHEGVVAARLSLKGIPACAGRNHGGPGTCCWPSSRAVASTSATCRPAVPSRAHPPREGSRTRGDGQGDAASSHAHRGRLRRLHDFARR